MQLLKHQIDGLNETKAFTHCAYYWTMGLGKTFVGSEKLMSFPNTINVVVCQKSKINDWLEHFAEHYPSVPRYNLSLAKEFSAFFAANTRRVGVINYDLLSRRKDLAKLKNIALVLDESSLIKNEEAKRTKAVLDLKSDKIILLSGTPVGGKYEELYSQCRLLGWNITKDQFWNRYIYYTAWSPSPYAKPIKIVRGYRNVDELKRKLREHGANFLASDNVLKLPAQTFQTHHIQTTSEYNTFIRDRIVEIGSDELRGDTTLTMMLGLRKLCSIYNKHKIQAFEDILQSTSERLIVFYNFNDELKQLRSLVPKNKVSVISGPEKDLTAYNKESDSVTFVQYQAGALGLNLQLANRIVYFSLPLSSELFEQSKKRIHRIGQTKPCYYHYLICKDSIESDILKTLNQRNDYTVELFRM